MRTARLRVIRDGALMARCITLPAIAAGITIAGPTLYAAVADVSLQLFDVATLARRTGVVLAAAPVAIATVPHAATPLVAVALRDSSVVVFNGASAVGRHSLNACVLGLFGGVHQVLRLMPCTSATDWSSGERMTETLSHHTQSERNR